MTNEEKLAKLNELMDKQATVEERFLTRVMLYFQGKKLDGLTQEDVKVILAYNEYMVTRREVSEAVKAMDNGGDVVGVVVDKRSKDEVGGGGLN